jgi:hypothetical protein
MRAITTSISIRVKPRCGRLRVVDLVVRRLGVGLAEFPDFSVIEQARTDGAVTHLGLGQLVAGIAVAADWLPRRNVGET